MGPPVIGAASAIGAERRDLAHHRAFGGKQRLLRGGVHLGQTAAIATFHLLRIERQEQVEDRPLADRNRIIGRDQRVHPGLIARHQ